MFKDFLRREFQEWYSKQILAQLEQGIAVRDLQPVDLCLSVMKPIGARLCIITSAVGQEWISTCWNIFCTELVVT